MALTNYTELKNAVAGWLHRDDLISSVPDFIALAESRLKRQLRVRQMITSGTLSTIAGTATVALPAGWLEFHRLRLVAPDRALQAVPSHQFTVKYQTAESGSPREYMVEGSNLVLGPKPDAVYSIEATYYAAVGALSDSASTNWLLTEWPSLYLFAALAESAPFVGQDSRVPLWEGKFAAELESCHAADRKARTAGSGLRIRVR